MYIVISGNIGAGKTSLAQIISEDLGFSVYFEDFHANVFLKDYYQDMKRWAFATQIDFLAIRYEQIIHHMLLSQIPAVLDRSIYEDREVFAKSLFEDGLMSEAEWSVYNKLYDLTFKLVTNESDGISSLAKIMSNNTVQNYIILAGKECSSLDEKIGYCGADLILYAQSLGLNTWWCGGMFNGKNALKHLDDKDVRVNGVIAIGYGKTQGVPHKSKTADQVSHYKGKAPEWFNSGIKALLLAPSALNRQPYIVTGAGNKVIFKVKSGFLSQVDLGIGKYFFELGAGKENFEWSSYDTN